MHQDEPSFYYNNYYWGKHDVIGAGATSLVYKAICNVINLNNNFIRDL